MPSGLYACSLDAEIAASTGILNELHAIPSRILIGCAHLQLLLIPGAERAPLAALARHRPTCVYLTVPRLLEQRLAAA